MSKKLIGSLLAAIFLIFSVPAATAADIPFLTWERGKEQNIVLGGNSIPPTWSIQLLSKDTAPLTFKRSTVSTTGYVVYSVPIPADFPVGYYTIEVFGEGADGGSVVAGVNVTAMTVYSITQIPSDLKSLLLWLTFIITAFSVARSKKYSKLRFIREKNLVETESLVADTRFPSILYKIYKLRDAGFQEQKPRLFNYLVKRDGNFTHRLSPVLWALLPAIGIAVGFICGFVSGDGPSVVPMYAVIVLAVIGLLDSYSGLFAVFAFASAQIMIGNITNVRSVLILICLGTAWAFSALLAEFFLLASRHDITPDANRANNPTKTKALIIPSAFVAGAFFFFMQRLADSLTTEIRSNTVQLLLVSAGVALLFIAKEILWERQDQKLLTKEDSHYITEEFQVVSLISPIVVAVMAVFITSVIFVWTQSLSSALIPGAILTVPFALLVFRFSSPQIAALAKWRRHIYLEAVVVTVISFGAHWIVSKTPNEVIHKSEILLALGFLPLLFHSVLSSLYDVSESQEVGAK
ncbi:MAG: hypothetical protein F2690_00695 [Actinobacteria bacterium]|nr:hypothetical protein [Actinomycetota bacterium]MSX71573.1 hypothetical protein [Actinomycetota bacterium]MSY69077.1 hypothetical protein [Actinomycetota bacterium]MTA75518.1 hypothetical protein [Actinomycetota bacterium]